MSTIPERPDIEEIEELLERRKVLMKRFSFTGSYGADEDEIRGIDRAITKQTPDLLAYVRMLEGENENMRDMIDFIPEVLAYAKAEMKAFLNSQNGSEK